MMIAAKNGHVDVLKELLKHKADINAETEEGVKVVQIYNNLTNKHNESLMIQYNFV